MKKIIIFIGLGLLTSHFAYGTDVAPETGVRLNPEEKIKKIYYAGQAELMQQEKVERKPASISDEEVRKLQEKYDTKFSRFRDIWKDDLKLQERMERKPASIEDIRKIEERYDTKFSRFRDVWKDDLKLQEKMERKPASIEEIRGINERYDTKFSRFRDIWN